jgi:hypothetical protein
VLLLVSSYYVYVTVGFPSEFIYRLGLFLVFVFLEPKGVTKKEEAETTYNLC